MAGSPHPRSPHSPWPAGRLAGRYRLERRLGSGSVGTVYLAHDEARDRPVALKILRADRFDSRAIGRLQEEFRLVGSLRHPRIAAAYDFGWLEGGRVPFFTREYVAGVPLAPGPPRARGPPARGPPRAPAAPPRRWDRSSICSRRSSTCTPIRSSTSTSTPETSSCPRGPTTAC